MPKHTFGTKAMMAMPVEMGLEEVYRPRVFLEASGAQIDECEVGEPCTVTIHGKVVALSVRDESPAPGGSIEIEISSTEVYGNEYDRMAKEEE